MLSTTRQYLILESAISAGYSRWISLQVAVPKAKISPFKDSS
jgi:hypothetical protein